MCIRDSLSFQKEEFDLIWSEGAIDNIGFEKGLTYWNGFLKKNGYVVVTCPSWFTRERPAEAEKFWADSGSGIDTIAVSYTHLDVYKRQQLESRPSCGSTCNT